MSILRPSLPIVNSTSSGSSKPGENQDTPSRPPKPATSRNSTIATRRRKIGSASQRDNRRSLDVGYICLRQYSMYHLEDGTATTKNPVRVVRRPLKGITFLVCLSIMYIAIEMRIKPPAANPI